MNANLNCTELEALLCDYVDGTLDAARRAEVEGHLSRCAACAELTRDAAAAVAFLDRTAEVEPPPALISRILQEIPIKTKAPERARAGARHWVRRLFEPILQPRLVMGMAMTILSFAMLGRFAGIEARPLRAADLDPAKVWMAMDDRLHRTWARTVKYYESLRLVYEIQSRLKEWSDQDAAEQAQTKPQPEAEKK
jgi:anti-sigma factor ChrR (cupin superfamily)